MSSLHLPDLSSLCLTSGFELRVNKNCRNVCLSSQRWTESSGSFSKEELSTLPSLNIGLLSSLCLPTADLLQLSVVANLLTLLSYNKDKGLEISEDHQFHEYVMPSYYSLQPNHCLSQIVEATL
jgi:hypothetical protein